MKLPGCRQIWYQSRTDCRKPLLLVDVESSVCKVIWKATNYLRKLWLGFFLLLTWYRSNFWVTLPCFDLKVYKTPRFSGLGSTGGTTFQVTTASEFQCCLYCLNSFSGIWFHNDLNIRSPILLEFKCDDLCGFLTMGESRYLFESQYMKLIFNPSSFPLFPCSCQRSNLNSGLLVTSNSSISVVVFFLRCLFPYEFGNYSWVRFWT